MSAIYVFGITTSAQPFRTEAIEQVFLRGLELTRIDAGSLSGIVAPVPDAMVTVLEEILADPMLAPELLVAHDMVVRSIFDQTAVLPCRFGTVLRDGEALKAWLAGQNEALHDRLSVLSNAAEWTIRLTAGDRSCSLSEKVEQLDGSPIEPCERGGRSGGSVLREKLARRRTERQRKLDRYQSVSQVHDTIRPLALEHSLKDPVHRRPGEAFCGSYLIRHADRGRLGSLISEIEERAARHGLDMRALGPLPPYSFSHALSEAGSRS